MTARRAIRGVFVSATLDMDAHFGAAFRALGPDLAMAVHGQVDDPAAIEFAVAWRPPADGFSAYPNLRLVASIASGTDNILACPSLPWRVPVIRMRDPAQAREASLFAIWHVLYWYRRFDRFLAQQRDRSWIRHPQPLAQETSVGVLGLGHIGGQIARDLAALGFRVRGYRRQQDTTGLDGIEVVTGVAGLETILGTSDILICALPLTEQSRGLLNSAAFSRMKPASVLIQLGRGEQLVEADLLAALDSGQLAGASLDVFASEPLPPQHPFWSHPRIVVTPHNASDVRPGFLARTLEAEMRRVLSGLPPMFSDAAGR